MASKNGGSDPSGHRTLAVCEHKSDFRELLRTSMMMVMMLMAAGKASMCLNTSGSWSRLTTTSVARKPMQAKSSYGRWVRLLKNAGHVRWDRLINRWVKLKPPPKKY
uniref:Uncharacterized protein n=1 Tax=Panagrellus redivivus TaxID=6233 RepID=A0A7E4UR95_PANRE